MSGLRSKAKAKGSVRVMVTLATRFTALGAMTSSEAKDQSASVLALSDDVRSTAVANGAKVNRTYGGNIPAIALSVTPAAIDALAASQAVAKIDPDIKFTTTDTTTTQLIGAADAQDRGFHGAGGGSGTAIMDTGVEYGHPAFGGRVAWASCFSAGSNCPNGATTQIGGTAGIPCTYAPGDCQHGTHVAGIAAGAGSVPGVADQAVITSIQVFSNLTCGGNPCARSYFSDITAGLNFAYDYRSIGYAAVNISIGGGSYTSNCDAEFATMKTAIDNLRSVNIATAIASGNDYLTNSVGAPACISTAITVGATNNADAVADFSNSSAQVDLYAPGVSVYSAIPGGSYGYKSGTSMATPHVVGSIAMMKAANPGLTVAQEEANLGSSGPLVTDSKSGLTRRRINVLQAMGQETITLTNDAVRDLRNPLPYDHRFATYSNVNYWSAVAVRPPAGADDDLYVYDNSNLTGYLAGSSYSGDVIDFVAQDSNRRTSGDWTYPVAHQYAGSGRYQIEYGNDALILSDSTNSISMGSSEIIEIRDSLHTAGVPTYYRVVPSNGGQNPEMFLMESTAGSPGTYVQGRGAAVAASSSAGPGGAEAFSHTAPASQYDGLVLINRAGSGAYTLYRDTSAPSGSVTINNGDATTTSQNVTLSLPASDGQTGMMDMRISVDGAFDSEPWVPYSANGTATLPGGAGTKTVDVQFRNNAGMVTSAGDTIELATVPGAPTVTGSTPSGGAVTVAFTPGPANGSPITGYTAQCVSTDGGANNTITGTASPITVNGLTGNKSYHCRVSATNAVGTGPRSTYGDTVVVTLTAPGAPTITSSTPLAGAVRVAFTPGNTGGSPVTGYTAQCVSTDGGANNTITGTASPITVNGLSGAKSYRCRVSATNAVGTGPRSAYGDTVTIPTTAPGRPTVTSTTPLTASARVAFTPGTDGGSPITGYTGQCRSTDGGRNRSVTGPASPITVTRLTSGNNYHCRVRATNTIGNGPYSTYGTIVTVL